MLLCTSCSRNEKVIEVRKECKANLEIQAKKMKINSDKKFPPASVGITVRVPIPDVDRGRGELRNILAVVMAVTQDGFYQLVTIEGILKQLYARNNVSISVLIHNAYS